MVDLDRTRDPEILRQVAKIQDAELRRVQQQMLALKRENEALKGATPDEIAERIAAFEQQLAQGYSSTYGSGSERRKRQQATKKAKKPQKGHGPTPQPNLRIERIDHDLDDADKICPTCGLDLEVFKGQYAESEEIDVVGVQYVTVQRVGLRTARCG